MSAMALTPRWLERIFIDDILEGREYPFILPLKVREIFWRFTKVFVGEEEACAGTASMACRIFERYLSRVVSRAQYMPANEWLLKKARLLSEIKLKMSVAIMIASKAQTTQVRITLKSVKLALRNLGDVYTLQKLKRAEIDMFRKLGYFIPISTNVAKVQAVAHDLGLSRYTVMCVAAVMDFIDLKLPTLYKRYKAWMLSPERSSQRLIQDFGQRYYIRSPHLIGSVVAATALYIEPDTQNVAQRVAGLMRCSQVSIDCLAEVIYEFLHSAVLREH